MTQWVTDHRKHHALSDQPGDPHSPHAHDGDTWIGELFGMWHAHVGWLFRTKGMERGEHYGRDLYEDRHDPPDRPPLLVWVALTFAIPFAVGWAVGGGAVGLGLQAMIWGGAAAHLPVPARHLGRQLGVPPFGTRDFRTRDESRNNWLLALLDVRRGLAQQPPRLPGQRPPRPAAAPVRPHRGGS